LRPPLPSIHPSIHPSPTTVSFSRSLSRSRSPSFLRIQSSEEVVEETEAAAAPEEEVVEDPFAGLDLGSKEFLQRKVQQYALSPT